MRLDGGTAGEGAELLDKERRKGAGCQVCGDAALTRE